MARAVEAVCREELRRAGLAPSGALTRLLTLMREVPETHLPLGAVAALASRAGLAATPVELARHLDTLVEHGLLARLPSTGAEPVFDTVTQPHSHLVYEGTDEVVDLHVSPETLTAILRQAIADQPGRVEVMLRIRAEREEPKKPSPP